MEYKLAGQNEYFRSSKFCIEYKSYIKFCIKGLKMFWMLKLKIRQWLLFVYHLPELTCSVQITDYILNVKIKNTSLYFQYGGCTLQKLINYVDKTVNHNSCVLFYIFICWKTKSNN